MVGNQNSWLIYRRQGFLLHKEQGTFSSPSPHDLQLHRCVKDKNFNEKSLMVFTGPQCLVIHFTGGREKWISRLAWAQLVITAHQTHRVKPEWRGSFCRCREGGLAKESSWAAPRTCTVATSKHTCPGKWSQMLICYSTGKLFATISCKIFHVWKLLFTMFLTAPIAQMSVLFSKLWEQKRNTSALAETGTSNPSVERKRKYALPPNCSLLTEIIKCMIRKLLFSQINCF